MYAINKTKKNMEGMNVPTLEMGRDFTAID